METLFSHSTKLFPCPICLGLLEVRLSSKKKPKPYVICNPCGVQLFVRGDSGIRQLARLLESSDPQKLATDRKALEQRYRRDCSKCGHKFWVEDKLAEISAWDGKVVGHKCPDCGAVCKVP